MQAGVCLVDGCKHLLVAVELLCQPRQLLAVAQYLLVERNEERQALALFLLLLVVEIDIFVDALDFRSVLENPFADDAIIHLDVWLCHGFGEIVQTEDFFDASHIQHLFRAFVDVGKMLCNGCLRYLCERLHVVHELGQVLMNESVSNRRRFLFGRIHVFPILVEACKVGRKVGKLSDEFLLFLIYKRVDEVFANEFFLEDSVVFGPAFRQTLCYDCAQIVLDFRESRFLTLVAF